MKKTLIVLVLCFLVLLPILYFSMKNPVQVPKVIPIDITHISLYHYFSGALSGGLNEALESVHHKSPHTKILSHALNHEAFKTMIVTTLDKGSPPEIFSYWAGKKTQKLVDNNQLAPLDDIWQTYSLDKLLSPALVKTASQYNGKNYFLPLDQHLVVFFYNKEIFNRLHLEPPSTYSQLTNIAKILKQNKIIPFALGAVERWPAQFWFDYLLLRTFGPEYRQSLMDNRSNYTDPEVVDIFKTWSELIKSGYFNHNANSLDWSEATQMLCSGEAGMTLMGTWAIQHLVSDSCGYKEGVDFGFFPFPQINANIPLTSVGPVDGLVLAREAENVAAAKNILPLFLDQKPQEAFSRGSGAFATSLKVPKSFYSPFKQQLFDEIEKSTYWAFNYDLATPPIIADFGLDSFSELLAYPNQYLDILNNLDQRVKKHLSPST